MVVCWPEIRLYIRRQWWLYLGIRSNLFSAIPWWGYTLDFTSWKEHSSLHLGIEGNEGIGLDIGPTLFYLNGVVNLGVSAIPFLGAFLFGYYEFAWPFFQAPFQTWGGYLKIPIGLPLNGFGP
jgi:hypothetical protein